MSDFKYDTDQLMAGDTFEGGPIDQSYFISAVMAAGGSVEIDGDVVRILYLPKKINKAKAPVSVPVVEKAPKKAEDTVEPPLVDLASEEAVVEEAPKVEAPKVKIPKVVSNDKTKE